MLKIGFILGSLTLGAVPHPHAGAELFPKHPSLSFCFTNPADSFRVNCLVNFGTERGYRHGRASQNRRGL